MAVTELVRNGIGWLVTRRRIRRGIKELMALDDQMLADIGLSRSELVQAARH